MVGDPSVSWIQPTDSTKQIGSLHPLALFFKVRAWTPPMDILDRLKNGHIESQSCKSAKQQGVVPSTEQRFRQHAGPPD